MQVFQSNTAMFYFMEFMERNQALSKLQFLMLAERCVGQSQTQAHCRTMRAKLLLVRRDSGGPPLGVLAASASRYDQETRLTATPSERTRPTSTNSTWPQKRPSAWPSRCVSRGRVTPGHPTPPPH